MEEFFISRKIRNQEFEMPGPHLHDVYEWYYLCSGSCKIFIEHSLYTMEAGDAILIPQGVLHRAVYPDATRSERITVSFTRQMLQPLLQVCETSCLEQLREAGRIQVPVSARGGLETLLLKMEEEMKEGTALSCFLARNHFFEVLVLLSRHCLYRQRESMGKTEELIQEAARYIYQNYEKPLTLGEVAGQFHITPSYFSRKFHQITGFGFKEYLVYVRISQAEKMLLQTKEPITEIAVVCGFGDGNYFGDVFKRIRGISPRQFRQSRGARDNIT